MSNAFAFNAAREINAFVASNPTQVPVIMAYLNESIIYARGEYEAGEVVYELTD